MRVIASNDLAEFVDTVGPWLGRDPVGNSIIITQLNRRLADPTLIEPGLLLWRVVNSGQIVGVTIRTPPYPMLVPEMPDAAAVAVGEQLRQHGVTSCNGATAARRALEIAAAGAEVRQTHGSGRFRMDTLVPPRPPGRGSPRLARPDELAHVVTWTDEFDQAARSDQSVPEHTIAARVTDGLVWFWVDDADRPLSMAQWSQPADGVVGINFVYTPERLRGRGYASALVAHIGGVILDRGLTPMLYTNLENPTSNKIYQAIGFEKVDEVGTFEIG